MTTKRNSQCVLLRINTSLGLSSICYIDEIGIEKIINDAVGVDEREIVTAGQIVKAIIINGLGFIFRTQNLFPQFFEDKATEHLIGNVTFNAFLKAVIAFSKFSALFPLIL